ncbi:MAG: hypothetical protein IH845_04835 [Nanoarchaeota archaeon]|nr:hypothetical protein [Nanoarchaeota archaeon]
MNENEVKDKLKLCNTLNEIFDVLDAYYDLDQRIGIISKSILINSVNKIILITGAKRKKWQEEEKQ